MSEKEKAYPFKFFPTLTNTHEGRVLSAEEHFERIDTDHSETKISENFQESLYESVVYMFYEMRFLAKEGGVDVAGATDKEYKAYAQQVNEKGRLVARKVLATLEGTPFEAEYSFPEDFFAVFLCLEIPHAGAFIFPELMRLHNPMGLVSMLLEQAAEEMGLVDMDSK